MSILDGLWENFKLFARYLVCLKFEKGLGFRVFWGLGIAEERDKKS